AAVLLFYFVYQSPSEDIVVVVYGDSRTEYEVHRKMVRAILSVKPTIVLHTGDLITDNPTQWSTFNDIVSEIRETAEFYPAIGNHEYIAGVESYLDNFDLPNNELWYSVERGGIHFIILDSNTPINKASEQYKWLESDLENIDEDIKFTIVAFHHPLFTTGLHPEDEKGLRQTIVPLFEQYDVDIVFSGHVHTYERCSYNNIYYITTGGGAAPLHDQIRTSSYCHK
ncbi:unnamed protein product, partial [marine sediment metagenome]